MTRSMQTGFSQRIELSWLERTAELVLAGAPRSEIVKDLDLHLRDRRSTTTATPRNNRDKTVTILLRTWVSVPDVLLPLRDDGLYLLQRVSTGDHVAIHWGMAMAVYPFFGLVAGVTGRLLRLQGHAGAAQVQRRVMEQLGERETVKRSTRRLLRTFVDWSVLNDTAEKGVYSSGSSRTIVDSDLRAWLIEAALRASGSDVAALRALTEAPALFPFVFAPTSVADIGSHTRLEWFRQGLSEDMVALKAG